MKLNLQKILTNLDGENLKDEKGRELSAGRLLAGQLVSDTKGDALKYLGWALDLNAGKEITVDESDLGTLRQFVKDSQVITNLAKGQILQELNRQETEQRK